MPTWQSHRGRAAVLVRDHGPDHPEAQAELRDMRAERLAEHVAKVVAQAPPLTDAQRERVVALLRAGAA